MHDAFQVEGWVRAVLANGTVRAELANGHQLVGFVAARDKQKFAGLKCGDRLRLQLTPFDLSSGRVMEHEQTI